MKAEIKNYPLSQDYELLWKLINEGHRIAAWLLYSDEFKEPIYDIVEVRINPIGEYNIGTRGIGYSGYETGKKEFLHTCKHYDLKFSSLLIHQNKILMTEESLNEAIQLKAALDKSQKFYSEAELFKMENKNRDTLSLKSENGEWIQIEADTMDSVINLIYDHAYRNYENAKAEFENFTA